MAPMNSGTASAGSIQHSHPFGVYKVLRQFLRKAVGEGWTKWGLLKHDVYWGRWRLAMKVQGTPVMAILGGVYRFVVPTKGGSIETMIKPDVSAEGICAIFATREQAEMAVERLVQE